jgi:hypothetical protein
MIAVSDGSLLSYFDRYLSVQDDKRTREWNHPESCVSGSSPLFLMAVDTSVWQFDAVITFALILMELLTRNLL